MLSESVAQNPTLAVREATKKGQNCPAFGPPNANFDGWESISPKPPAAEYAHANSTRPSVINSGALMFKRMRIDSIPL
jgi:hypothetical protein